MDETTVSIAAAFGVLTIQRFGTRSAAASRSWIGAAKTAGNRARRLKMERILGSQWFGKE